MKNPKENVIDKEFENAELNKLAEINKSIKQYNDKLETINNKIKELEDFTIVFDSLISNIDEKLVMYAKHYNEEYNGDPLLLYGKGKFGTEEEKQKIIEQRKVAVDELDDARNKIKALQEDKDAAQLIEHVYKILNDLKKERQEIIQKMPAQKASSSDYDTSKISNNDEELIKKKLSTLAAKKKEYQSVLSSLEGEVKESKKANIETKLANLDQQIDTLKSQLSPQIVEEILEGTSYEEGYNTNVGNEVDGDGSDYITEILDTLALLNDKISDIALNVQIKQNTALKMFNVLAVSYHKGHQVHKDKVKAFQDAKAANEEKTKATQDLIVGLLVGAAITTGVGVLATPIAALEVYAGAIIKDIAVDTAKKVSEVTITSIVNGKGVKPIPTSDVAPQFMEQKIKAVIYDKFNSILTALTGPSTQILQLRENLIEIKKKEQWEMVSLTTKEKVNKLQKQVDSILTEAKKEIQKAPAEEASTELIKDTEFTFWAAWILTNENLITRDDYAGSDKCEALQKTIYPDMVKLGMIRNSLLKQNIYERGGYKTLWDDACSWAKSYKPSLNVWKKGLGI